MVNVFAVPVFFICFRECLETSIVVSILLASTKRVIDPINEAKAYKRAKRQVWVGVGVGVVIALCIGAGMIAAFYTLGKNSFATSENIWEGVFAIVASVIISLMGVVLLRVNKLQDKWRAKIAQSFDRTTKGEAWSRGFVKRWSEENIMFLLPLVTVLREGLEAIIFIGGVGIGEPATAFPIPVITGLAAGCLVGLVVYWGGNYTSVQIFLVVSTCFLYLVAAGLFSRGVWSLGNYSWTQVIGGDTDQLGSGPGSYDIRRSVWHVNCCNPQYRGGGGWGVFYSLFGWTNSATYGSVISYNVYWLTIIIGFVVLRFSEKRGGWHRTSKNTASSGEVQRNESSDQTSDSDIEKVLQKPVLIARDVSTRSK